MTKKSYMTRIKFCLTSRPFITAVILLSAFFVFNFVLAADNNTVYPTCASPSCDTNQTTCNNVTGSGHWTADGYPSGAGNAQCCADDSQENFLNCQISTEGGVSCGSNTQACCDINSKCVYNGACLCKVWI